MQVVESVIAEANGRNLLQVAGWFKDTGMGPVLVIDEGDADRPNLLLQVRRAGYECLSVLPAAIEFDPPASSLVLIGDISAGASLEQLRSWRTRFANIPCVVLTGESPSIRSEIALQGDVSGTLPRADLESGLVSMLHSMLGAPADDSSRGTPRYRDILYYTIENKPELLPLIVSAVRQRLEDWPFEDSIDLVRVTVALGEALDNALYHGNLDLSSDLRQGTGQSWRDESLARRNALPYRDRRIRFQAMIDGQGAEFVIRDEGVGFNPALLSDCTQTENLERCSGRGMMLMKMYMDDVRFNATGNEITLKKYRPAELSSAR